LKLFTLDVIVSITRNKIISKLVGVEAKKTLHASNINNVISKVSLVSLLKTTILKPFL